MNQYLEFQYAWQNQNKNISSNCKDIDCTQIYDFDILTVVSRYSWFYCSMFAASCIVCSHKNYCLLFYMFYGSACLEDLLHSFYLYFSRTIVWWLCFLQDFFKVYETNFNDGVCLFQNRAFQLCTIQCGLILPSLPRYQTSCAG